MTTPQRMLLVAALIAGAQAAVRATERYLKILPAAAPEQRLARAIPFEFERDQWHGGDVALPSDVFDTLAATDVVNRDYQNPIGETVGANVAVFTDYSLSPPHPPLVCYPADGWTLKDTQLVPLSRDDARSPNVPVYSFERQGEQILVMFWMDLDGEIVFDRDGIRSVLRALRGPGVHQPLLKKVMLYTGLDAPERAQLRLRSVASSIFTATRAFH